MKKRCYDVKHKSYKHYGQKGIEVCEEWKNNFVAFKNWTENNGYIQGEDLEVDRVDSDKNYEPSNCRIIKAIENNRFKRSTKLNINNVLIIRYEYSGSNIIELADKFGVSTATIYDIINNRTWVNI